MMTDPTRPPSLLPESSALSPESSVLSPQSSVLNSEREFLTDIPYLKDAPLAKYTTWRVGGPAAYLVLPRSNEQVQAARQFAEATGLPWIVIGCGSNLLVADSGVPGVVIRLADNFNSYEFAGNDLVAQAGASLPRLAREAVDRGLAGLEFAVNIPGAVGGGVFMNAGCYGGSVADTLVEAELLGPDGIMACSPAQLEMRYRHTRLMDEPAIVLGARFRLVPGDPEQLKAHIEDLRLRRRLAQPPGSSCGSVFKNPGPDQAAGYLIEQAGAKGWRCGDAQISPQHANFLLNLGGATAGQIYGLILQVRERVRERFGVQLTPEVRLLGDVQPSNDPAR